MPAETVTRTELWLPILLSSVGVFFASSLVWMVLPHHKSDWSKLNDEDGVMAAMRNSGAAPGQYMFPHCASNKDMADPVYQEKLKQGPCGFLIVKPFGAPNMGKNLAMWFVYLLVIGVFVAYMSSNTLAAGSHYLSVFRIAGTVAFLGYALSSVPAGIWWGHRWGNVVKEMIDGTAYALITAGVFGWLWPGAGA